MKRIFVSVSNDVYNDNRVKKTCRSLNSYGLDVHVLCKKSLECNNSSKTFYKTHPIKFFFKKNFLYYAELNTKLFFKLIFKRIDILWANDLDTLLPLFIISKLRNKPLIYDSHELFTQVPELNANPFAKKIWLFIEKHTVPKLKYVITVCNPIKDYFKKEYNIEAKVVRNIPLYNKNNQISKHYPLKEKIIVWQGAANIDRSLEDLVLAMKEIDAKLIIMGRGDIIPTLKQEIKNNNLEDKVFLLGRLPFEEMMEQTRKATIGLSLDRPTNENYKISLPNKIFEYINAATPLLCTPLQEIKNIVEQYSVGKFIENPDSINLINSINHLLNNNDELQKMSDNCLIAQKELSWQKEEKEIFDILDTITKNKENILHTFSLL